MRKIKLKSENCLSDADADLLAGQFLTSEHFDLLIEDSCDVLKPNGDVLFKYRKKVIPAKLCTVSYPVFRDAAGLTSNRGMAAGAVVADNTPAPNRIAKSSYTRFKRMKKDGTVSNTVEANQVNSGIVGYFDRNPRNPYCRLTAFNLANEERFNATLPFIRFVDDIFQKESPERHRAQMKVVKATSKDFYIHGTAFTTITVNKNFQTAVHKDAGDLKEGFGVMSCLRAGHYEGCFLCWPKFRVAVNLGTADVILADVHEWHGNTKLIGKPGRYERISLVFYYREGIKECGTATEELERAKNARGKL